MAEDSEAGTSFAQTKELSDIELTDCLLRHMDISVVESEKRATSALNFRDYYVVYLIDTRIKDKAWGLVEHGLGQLWRRYSEFEQLRNYLCSTYPWAVIPPLPEKKHTFPAYNIPTDTFDPDFIDRRRAGLENFLRRVASHPTLSKDSMFLMFLQQEEAWRHSIRETGYLRLAEDKIKSLSAGVRIMDSDPELEQIRKYSSDLHGSIHNLLRIRAKIATKVYNVHKLHSSYGKVFSEWSAIEKEMGDGLQRAGHYFDSIASTVTSALEDEEQLIDQLKEYYYYANALDDICSKRDVLQLDLEHTQEQSSMKQVEKEKIIQGRSGVMSRLFGSSEPESIRSFKINQLEHKLQENEDKIKTQAQQIQEFRKMTANEIHMFEQQKDNDIRDIMENFIKLQIKATKKSLQAWTNIKDCVNSIPP